MIWPLPSALSSLSSLSPCPSQTTISALAHLPLYLGRGGPKGAQVDHSLTTWWLVNYSAKMIIPPLASWFPDTWTLNTQAIVRVYTVFFGRSVLPLRTRVSKSIEPRVAGKGCKSFKQVTGKDEQWDHFCSYSLIPRTMYLSFWEYDPYEGLWFIEYTSLRGWHLILGNHWFWAGISAVPLEGYSSDLSP